MEAGGAWNQLCCLRPHLYRPMEVRWEERKGKRGGAEREREREGEREREKEEEQEQEEEERERRGKEDGVMLPQSRNPHFR